MVTARQDEDFFLEITHFCCFECHLRVTIGEGSEPMSVLMACFRINRDRTAVEKRFLRVSECSTIIFQCRLTFPVEPKCRKKTDRPEEFVSNRAQCEYVCTNNYMHDAIPDGHENTQSVIKTVLVVRNDEQWCSVFRNILSV